MLQRSSLPTTSPAEIADTLGRSLEGPFDGRRWQALQNALPLPVTWQQYLLACLAIGIVVGGLCFQVLLSVQIADRQLTLRQLRSDYARVERQNSELIYAIARQSSLAQMAQLAAQSGFVPATNRTYIVRTAAESLALGAGIAPSPVRAAQNGSPTPTPPENVTWLDQTRQWWEGLQQSISTATGQLWRDFAGRME